VKFLLLTANRKLIVGGKIQLNFLLLSIFAEAENFARFLASSRGKIQRKSVKAKNIRSFFNGFSNFEYYS
jgi:hypothetical protein